MELANQSKSPQQVSSLTHLYKRHWSFHLLVVLSLLQVTGHLVSVYHLVLLKPLPIILLFFLCEKKARQEKTFAVGLVFSLIGDLCLLVKNILVFQIGTGFFLIAHLLYIRAFMYDISWKKLLKLGRKRSIVIITFISFIMTLLAFNMSELWHKTPNLLLFLIYGIVLSAMAIFSSLRECSDSSYLLMLIGALLFGVSDNTLAYLKFNGISTEAGAAFIMLTYYSAQCLLA